MSPVVHVNKPLKELKKKRNGLIAKVIATNLFILSFFGLTLGIIKYVIIGTALLQLITKGGKDYVE
jgi:hypothetical protein